MNAILRFHFADLWQLPSPSRYFFFGFSTLLSQFDAFLYITPRVSVWNDHISPTWLKLCRVIALCTFFSSLLPYGYFFLFVFLVRHPVVTDWKLGSVILFISRWVTQLGFTSMSSVRSWAQTSIPQTTTFLTLKTLKNLSSRPSPLLPNAACLMKRKFLFSSWFFTHRKQLILFSILDKPPSD